MARWKYGDNGQLYYDQNDSGPDQGQPTPEQQAQQQGGSTTPTQPYTVPQPSYPDKSDPGYWTDPNRSEYQPGNPIWPYQTTDPNTPGYQDPNKPQPIDGGFNSGNGGDPNNWASILFDPSQRSPTTGINGGATSGTPVATAPAPTTSAAPLGFDAAKWADPTQGTSSKYVVGRILAGGGSIEDAAKAVGAKVISPDKIQYPDGFIADVYFDYGGPEQRVQYTDVTPGGGTASGGGTDMAGRSGGISASALGGMFGSGASTNGLSGLFGGDAANSLYNTLMQRAGQNIVPNASDPIIANQVNAYSAQQQRAGRDYIDDLAESRGPISNLQGEKRLMAEKIGQGTGAFQAQLMQKEVDARRQEIQQALSGMMGFLTEEQRMSLQRELEYLNMGQRAYEFDENNEFRRSPLAS